MIIIDRDLESTLWYTGSTIAPTLSAGMGLLGAIMLFALSETSKSIARAAVQLAAHPHPTINPAYIHYVLTRRGFRELAKRYGDELIGATERGTSVEMLAQHSTLTWELEHDAMLRRSFWKALMASGVMIAFSIIVCSLAPNLSAHVRLGQAVLIISVARGDQLPGALRNIAQGAVPGAGGDRRPAALTMIGWPRTGRWPWPPIASRNPGVLSAFLPCGFSTPCLKLFP